ncbi:hypothetical protein, partial [Bacillus badius]|uniref:hypothetical protein n=1 Tax=Bacillus badius TaxID=1455 RepID=UPI002E1F4010|nr:hypothetical protein [Bacillus badius]
ESARLPFQSTECTKRGKLYRELKVRKRLSKHHPVQQDQIDRIALDQLVPGNDPVQQIEQTMDNVKSD